MVESLGARVRNAGSRGFAGTGPNLIQWQPIHLLTQSPFRHSRSEAGSSKSIHQRGANFMTVRAEPLYGARDNDIQLVGDGYQQLLALLAGGDDFLHLTETGRGPPVFIGEIVGLDIRS